MDLSDFKMGDFDAIDFQFEKLKTSSSPDKELKKINIILKIVSKNPILKKAKELKQLVLQSLEIFALILEKQADIDKALVIENTETMLNYLKKENILNPSNSIVEVINRLGLIRVQFEKGESRQEHSDTDLQNIRKKIVKHELVKNDKLLKSLADNPKN